MVPFVYIAGFVRESNAIEGIYRTPTEAELDATEAFLKLPQLGVDDLRTLVSKLGYPIRDDEEHKWRRAMI